MSDNLGNTAFAAVMALATALHLEGVLPMEKFIATLRKHALAMKGRGAEAMAEQILEMASELAQGLPPQSR